LNKFLRLVSADSEVGPRWWEDFYDDKIGSWRCSGFRRVLASFGGTSADRLEAQKERYDSDALGIDEEAASFTLPSKPSGTIS
jgi:hypothetical protein